MSMLWESHLCPWYRVQKYMVYPSWMVYSRCIEKEGNGATLEGWRMVFKCKHNLLQFKWTRLLRTRFVQNAQEIKINIWNEGFCSKKLLWLYTVHFLTRLLRLATSGTGCTQQWQMSRLARVASLIWGVKIAWMHHPRSTVKEATGSHSASCDTSLYSDMQVPLNITDERGYSTELHSKEGTQLKIKSIDQSIYLSYHMSGTQLNWTQKRVLNWKQNQSIN